MILGILSILIMASSSVKNMENADRIALLIFTALITGLSCCEHIIWGKLIN